MEDGVASTLWPLNNREYVARDVIHTIKNAQNEIRVYTHLIVWL